ncbi:MAG: type I restriction enzyme EcoKI subunit R [Pelotomaculum sp. PtaB.Bin104]|nr:MAG: type I restriction enzyme EcoKI subunit R [Pelotomaculum sp. PtaB.Bin104]
MFCVNINHAERMRQALINENADLVAENPRYIMRITGDNPEGKAQLDNFIDEDSKYPTIVTTSKLMTTGVDCKTTKLIVLDNHIESMTEFKQIIGRGTRLKPDYGKLFFTIMDFRNASRLFADKSFDGDPVQVYEPPEGASPVPPDSGDDGAGDFGQEPGGEYQVIYRVNDVPVRIISQRVQYYDRDGKLITESLIDYTRKNILQEYATLDDFLRSWRAEERKQAIIDELKEHGVLLAALREQAQNIDLDDFDLICHIVYDQKPFTRAERANNVKKRGYLP